MCELLKIFKTYIILQQKMIQSHYQSRMMQNNNVGKRNTLTVDWLNIWEQKSRSKKPKVYYYQAVSAMIFHLRLL